jgi:prepilin-type N-terminal cleavage/methylation domain-containing protein
MQKKQGFTLIELLVVIAIIGILAAIGITAFAGAQGRARDAKRKADLGALNSNLTLWLDTNTNYPASASITVACEVNGCANLTSTAGFAGRYAVPKSPSYDPTCLGTPANCDNNDYWYITDSATAATQFAVFTKMETGTTNWFVSNSKGYSDEIAGTNGATVKPSTANSTECADTNANDATRNYMVCLANPDID